MVWTSPGPKGVRELTVFLADLSRCGAIGEEGGKGLESSQPSNISNEAVFFITVLLRSVLLLLLLLLLLRHCSRVRLCATP